MVSLSEAQMPHHTHSLMAQSLVGNRPGPQGNSFARTLGAAPYLPADSSLVSMSSQAVLNTGGSQPHNNLQPYLVLNFIIALVGLYPSRG